MVYTGFWFIQGSVNTSFTVPNISPLICINFFLLWWQSLGKGNIFFPHYTDISPICINFCCLFKHILLINYNIHYSIIHEFFFLFFINQRHSEKSYNKFVHRLDNHMKSTLHFIKILLTFHQLVLFFFTTMAIKNNITSTVWFYILDSCLKKKYKQKLFEFTVH